MKAPFDNLANEYDQAFTNSSIGKIQRKQVWSYLDTILPKLAGKEILELTCGTGEDAILFAKRGFNVLATDSSEIMLNVAASKINRFSLGDKIETRKIDLEELDKTNLDKKFDLIFSNFGGINCISPEKFESNLTTLNQLLNRNGRIVFVFINDFCLWETLYYSLKFDFKKAFRRITAQPTLVRFSDKEFFIWYRFAKVYNGHVQFKKTKTKAIAVFTPPSYLEHFFNNHPKMLKVLETIDTFATKFSIASHLSDHILIELKPR